MEKRTMFISLIKNRMFIVPSLLLFVTANVLLSYFNNSILKSPLFLDSVFTAIGAVLYGPVFGVITGLLTNIGMEFIYGMNGLYWPFASCSMATGLILGLMSRKGYFSKNFHATAAILAVTLVNSLLGSLIAYFVFAGETGVYVDQIVKAIIDTGISLLSATFWARIPANLIDKMISVYLAFGIFRYVFVVPERDV